MILDFIGLLDLSKLRRQLLIIDDFICSPDISYSMFVCCFHLFAEKWLEKGRNIAMSIEIF